MKAELLLASRYFFSKKKRGFIQFISLVSMLGVGIGAAALVIVLSVFNGLAELNREIFRVSYPDLRIQSENSKTFSREEIPKKELEEIPEIAFGMEVLEDRALGKNRNDQIIIEMKGLDTSYTQLKKLNQAKVEGEFVLENEFGYFSYVGAGVYNSLNLLVNDFLDPLEIWYPKNQKLQILNPEDNIAKATLTVSGVFALEEKYDQYVYLALPVVEELTGKFDQRTGYEIYLQDEKDIPKIKSNIQKILPTGFEIKDRDELNASLFKAIQIEKLFIFIALLFIIGIASFNIFYSLSMLVLDKKDDIETMSAMGASEKFIQRIFLLEGGLVGILGAFLGFLIGCGLVLSQMYFGWLKMGMQFAVVDAYPVKLETMDVVLSVLGILLITFLASYFPSRKAKTFMKTQ